MSIDVVVGSLWVSKFTRRYALVVDSFSTSGNEFNPWIATYEVNNPIHVCRKTRFLEAFEIFREDENV